MRALLPAVACLPLLAACGGANPVLPGAMTAGGAAGEACDPAALKDEAMTFVVDWQDSQRAAVESAMGKGVAVVKYACDGMKVLSSCRVRGDYKYAGASIRKKLISMQDAIQAQAQFGGRMLGAAFAGAFAQARTLHLAYMTVGAEGTTVAAAHTGMLTGRCTGATHFVYEAQVGAFAVETTESGEASALAQVFGQGSASGATAAQKASMTADGDLAACTGASKQDTEQVEGCAARVRLALIPIDPAPAGAAPVAFRKAGVPDLQRCPGDFALVDGICVAQSAPEAKTSATCAPNDFAGCMTRCLADDVASCGRFGLIMLEKEWLKRADSTWDAAQFKAQAKALSEPLKMACLTGEPNACVAAGQTLAIIGYPGQDSDESWKTPGAIAMHKQLDSLNTAGCQGGEGVACEQLIASINLPETLQSMSVAQMLPVLEQGCAKSAYACLSLGGLHAHNDGVQSWAQAVDAVQLDPGVARMAFTRACDGGLADGCWALGLMHFPEDDITSLAMQREVDRGTLSTVGAFARLGKGRHDVAQGKALLKRACDLGEAAFVRAPREEACALSQ